VPDRIALNSIRQRTWFIGWQASVGTFTSRSLAPYVMTGRVGGRDFRFVTRLLRLGGPFIRPIWVASHRRAGLWIGSLHHAALLRVPRAMTRVFPGPPWPYGWKAVNTSP